MVLFIVISLLLVIGKKTRKLLVNDDFELARSSYLYEGFT
jgi:hypothetical protein